MSVGLDKRAQSDSDNGANIVAPSMTYSGWNEMTQFRHGVSLTSRLITTGAATRCHLLDVLLAEVLTPTRDALREAAK